MATYLGYAQNVMYNSGATAGRGRGAQSSENDSRCKGPSPPSVLRTIDRVLDDSQYTGEMNLSGRKLKEFPRSSANFDLVDTAVTDLSKNRFTELPIEVCCFHSLEKLNCYHNVIKSLPAAIAQLQNLVYLNLSRNQLSMLPAALCELELLEVLLVSNNRLVSLPEEIGQLGRLMQLDVSNNEITQLPNQLGNLFSLRSLGVGRNLLVELPIGLSRLKLLKLDISSNRIVHIPCDFRNMTTLETLRLDSNPLISPPAHICTKGLAHIMKYLHTEAVRDARKRGVIQNDVNIRNIAATKRSSANSSNGDWSDRTRHPMTSHSSASKLYSCVAGDLSSDDKPRADRIRGDNSDRPRSDTSDRSWSDSGHDRSRHALNELQDTGSTNTTSTPNSFSAYSSSSSSSFNPNSLTRLKKSTSWQPGQLSNSIRSTDKPILVNGTHQPQRKENIRHPKTVSPDSGHSGSRIPENIVYSGSRIPENTVSSGSRIREDPVYFGSLRRASSSTSSSSSSGTHTPVISTSAGRVTPIPLVGGRGISRNGDTGDMDEFTRELQRQKADYEAKRKKAEQVRLQVEESERIRRQANQESRPRNSESAPTTDVQESERRRQAALRLAEQQQQLRHRSHSSTAAASSPPPAAAISLPVKHIAQSHSLSEVQQQQPAATTHSNTRSTGSHPPSRRSESLGSGNGGGSPSYGAPQPHASYSRLPSGDGDYNSSIASGSSSESLRQNSENAVNKTTIGVMREIPITIIPSAISSGSVQAEVRSNGVSQDGTRSGSNTSISIPINHVISSPHRPSSSGSDGSNHHGTPTPMEDDLQRRQQGLAGQHRTVADPQAMRKQFEEERTRILGVSRVLRPMSNDGNGSFSNDGTPNSSFSENVTQFTSITGSSSFPFSTERSEFFDPMFNSQRSQPLTESELIELEKVRKAIESTLGMKLGADIPGALRDGVVLCHLANHIRPRSVTSIHVPSPAVPKLSQAKCRKNVDSFLLACRRIGVDQNSLCTSTAVLEDRGMFSLAQTVQALIDCSTQPKQSAV